jgi:hypothetical protein
MDCFGYFKGIIRRKEGYGVVDIRVIENISRNLVRKSWVPSRSRWTVNQRWPLPWNLGPSGYLSEECRYLPPQTRKPQPCAWLVLVLPLFFVLRISFLDFVTRATRLVQPPVMAA